MKKSQPALGDHNPGGRRRLPRFRRGLAASCFNVQSDACGSHQVRPSSAPNHASSSSTTGTLATPPLRAIEAASCGNDTAFDNDADYRLFVEATVGLPPEDTWKAKSISPGQADQVPTAGPGHYRRTLAPSFDRDDQRTGNVSRLPANTATARPHQLQRAARATNLEFWDEGGVDTPPDELPSYADSQAEVERLKRLEASRRAQELQSQWRMSSMTRD